MVDIRTTSIGPRLHGCLADGTLGHNHVRRRLSELVQGFAPGSVPAEVLERLSEIPPDSSENTLEGWDDDEGEALEALRSVCDRGTCLDFRDGDLVCYPVCPDCGCEDYEDGYTCPECGGKP